MLRIRNVLNYHIRYAEVLYWILFMSSIITKCLYFQFTTKLNNEPYISPINTSMFLSSFAILLMICSFIALVFNKKRILALFFTNTILSILLLSDTIFFRYYSNLITIPVLHSLDNSTMSTANQSISSLFIISDFIFIADLFIFLTGLILLNKKIIRIQFPKRLFRFVTFLVISLVTFIPVYQNANITVFAYNNNYSARSLGVLYSHFYSTKLYLKDWLFEKNNLTSKEKKLISDFFRYKNQTGESKKYYGIASDKNLIIVQIEAIQHFVINKSINGNEITPNLNKLINESFYFDEVYYQTSGGNTSDAEFLCNTSLYPADEGSVYYMFAENTYYSLPSALKDKGYTTYALHAFHEKFWNRPEMYAAFKFDNYFSEGDYIMDDFAGWQGEALSDSSFFRQSLDKIDTSNPFYSFFITLSSHYPFTYFEDYEFDVGELEKTYLGAYLKAANYADKCIGQFIDNLKKRGLYDESLLVLYGDHSAVPRINADELMQFLEIEYSEPEWIKLQKVPLIIRYPGQKTSTILYNTGGQIDILPTISNLMGFDFPYAIGKDLLNTNDNYVILRNGSIVTNNYIYLNDLRELYNYHTGEVLDIRPYVVDLSQYLNELHVSDTIILKDWFKYKH
ncbi:UNVERIFIED_CONTAM: phosphoglycerol transferase MdoB-like AlkP superfamily enzyme [Acetivibrio alkalicellulosi]